MPAIESLRAAIDEQRADLSSVPAGQIRSELFSARRPWENRLPGRSRHDGDSVPSRSCCGLTRASAGWPPGAVDRARTPAQLALWGAVQGASDAAEASPRPAVAAAARPGGGQWFRCDELRRAAVVLEGYAAEAGLPKASASVATLEAEEGGRQLELRRTLVAGSRCPHRPAGPTAYRLVTPAGVPDPPCWPCRASCFSGWERTSSTIPGGWPCPQNVGRGVGYRLGLLVRALVFPVALAVYAASVRRTPAGRRPPGRALGPGLWPPPASRRSWKTIAAQAREFRRNLELLQGDVERLRGSV